MEKIKNFLLRLKDWSINYEDDVSFSQRMEAEHG